jgi:hypothetical protein
MARGIRYLLLYVALALLPLAPAAAQEQLPSSLKGRWVGMGQQAGRVPVDFEWSLEITKQNSDGSIEGTMSYGGSRCSAKNAPMTGTFDGKQLVVSAMLEPKAQCGKQTFRMVKRGGKHLFEGRGQDREGWLDPR